MFVDIVYADGIRW